MTNPLARVAMKNLSDFKPVGKPKTTGKTNNNKNAEIGGNEENLIKNLINGEIQAEGIQGKQVFTLEELANKMKNNY